MASNDDISGRNARRGEWTGRDWLLLAVVTLLAFVAWMQVGERMLVGISYAVAILALFLRTPGEAGDKASDAESSIIARPQDMSAVTPDIFGGITAGVEGLDIPVFILGKDAAVLFQNRCAARMMGELPPGAHVSARLRSPGVLDMIRDTIANGEPNQIEHSERLPSERIFLVRIAPAGGAQIKGTRSDYYVLSLRDISELRRIERMRSDFVANASHELRTPLSSLRGFIETMQGPAKDDATARERFLGIMLDQATRMSRLVDDLLSLSRFELRAHIAPDQPVDLVPVIGHVRDALLPLATELGVEIDLHLPEGSVEVTGDRDELVQVFENLVENACKYGQEGKKVDVWLRNEAGKPVEVSVVDYGSGIPAEHVPRLTERFYRVSVTDSRSKKGTGLGLAIVKHILTRHRARLLVRSEIGAGTDFTVRF